MKQNLFKIAELALPGVLLIEPRVCNDERGATINPYSVKEFAENGIDTSFVQDLTSYSKKNVLRGLHFQHPPHEQTKLVRCSSGKIFDVVADYNIQSPTFGQHISVTLKGEDQTSLYIPDSYAHGFCVLSEDAVVEYKLGSAYHQESVGGIRFDDPAFDIPWPIIDPIISEQDKEWPSLK